MALSKTSMWRRTRHAAHAGVEWIEGNPAGELLSAASRAAAYNIGFVPSKKAAQTKPKFIWLLNADGVDPKSIPSDAFVVFQGHHGDLGAQLADVIVPGAAYTEKAHRFQRSGLSNHSLRAVAPTDAHLCRQVTQAMNNAPRALVAAVLHKATAAIGLV
ncbi:hypothetical protein EV122DRAFT_281674 [Schizophyllum commune]